ncbi:MAG: tetratricopeptide repeat-containing serine/threonine-protein kinase [Verrucomicrobiales bacterium]|nr:tetratricopeptide repeat-containing serine/threonine-protein kinase [Verrucomicrobiales bacterium]
MNLFKIDEYQVDQSPIGAGCTGEVFRATHIRSGNTFAAKRFNSMAIDYRLLDSIYQRYQAAPEHEGIVELQSFRFNHPPYFAVTSFESGKRLLNAGPFKESKSWSLIKRLAAALDHAHKYGLVHGNLHPGNIFYSISEEDCVTLRVGDFGAGMIGEAHHVDLDETAYYAPPEQLLCLGRDHRNGQAERWDVYRFGAVAFWLLNQTPPRGKLYLKLRSQQIAESGGRPVPVDPVALATIVEKDGKLPWRRRIGHGRKEERYKEIIEQCLKLNPAKRPVDMREVHQAFEDIEKEFALLDTEERAAAELVAAESRVTRERIKQKTKLFTARALVTILAAAVIIATFYLVEYLQMFREEKVVTSELGQEVSNLKAHRSFLGNKLEDTVVELKQSRAAADASFYSSMILRDIGEQTGVTLMKDLERARTYYVGILKEVSLKPEALAERARALHSLAHIEEKMTRNDEALDHFQKAINAFEKTLKSNNPTLDEEQRHDTVSRLADCYENVGMLNEKPGSEEALEALSMAIWYLKQVLINDPKDTLAATRLAESSFYLGQTLDRRNRYEEAISAYSEAAEQAVELRNQSQSDEKNENLDRMIANLQFFAAESLRKVGRDEESVDAYIAAIESIERLRSLEGYAREETIMMAKSFLALGDIFDGIKTIGREDKDQVYNEALRLIVPLNRVSPENVEIATLMCHSLTRLARLELSADHWRDGYNLSVRGIEVLETALEQHEGDLEGQIQLAEARLWHLDFIEDNKTKSRMVSLRGVESATKAHKIFVSEADRFSEPVKKRYDIRLRRIFSSYSTICAELGQNKTASECLNYASFKLSYRNGTR